MKKKMQCIFRVQLSTHFKRKAKQNNFKIMEDFKDEITLTKKLLYWIIGLSIVLSVR